MKERIDFKHPELTNMIEDCLRDSIISTKKEPYTLKYNSNLKIEIRKYSKNYYNIGFLKKLVVDILKYINEYVLNKDSNKIQEIMQTEVCDIIKTIKEKRRIDNRENKFKRICDE